MSERSEQLQSILVAYIEAAEKGQAPRREELLARHPEFAAELAEFLDGRERIQQIAPPPAEMATLPPTEMPTVSLGTLRYFGDYELLEEIARGGMGVVFKARQVSANRLVAVKLILAGRLSSAEDVRRFRSEAEAAANLDHPHIVPIYEVSEYAGQQYYSMKLVEDGSLSRHLPRLQQDPQATATLLATVAQAVHYAHQRGIIHRDLKPANILLNTEGQPLVTDFGLAKHVESDAGVTPTGAIVGTPAYMAPEQAEGRGRRVGPAADVYSLGAILYECLTGRPPFQAATLMETLRQVIVNEPVPPIQLRPKTPRDLETICLKCLRKEPEQRYDSAAALAEDLRRWQAGEPILARPVGRVERAAKWVRRNRVVTALLAAVVLALLAGTVISTYFAVEAQHQANEARAAQKIAEDEKRDANAARSRADREKRHAEDQLSRTQLAWYAGQLAEAQRQWQDDHLGRALEILDNCQRDLRNVEHRYLWARWNSRQTFPGHIGPIPCVAYSPDGKRFVTGSRGNTATVWDAEDGRELLALKRQTYPVSSVAFSPDGNRILTGTFDDAEPGKPGEVKMWDAETGKELLTLKGHTQPVTSVAFSPDGKRLLTGSGGRNDMLMGDIGEVKLWNAENGQELLSFKGHTDRVTSVSFSPDGTRILTGSDDATAKVWDAQRGRQIFSLNRHTQPVTSAAFSPDGKRIVTGSADHEVKVWDAEKGQELLSIDEDLGQITSVAFSPDGQRIVAGSVQFLSPGRVRVWDADKGQQLLSYKNTSGVRSVVFSPDGKRLLAGCEDGAVKVWDAGKGLGPLDSGVSSMALSPDGKRLLIAVGFNRLPGEVKVWDAETGQELLVLSGKAGRVYRVAFSPDGKRLLTGGADEKVRVWDAETGQELLVLSEKASPVSIVAFSPDGKRIVSGSSDQTVKVWNAETGQELLSFQHTSGVSSVAFSPDSKRIVSGCWDNEKSGEVKVWDAQTGQELLDLKGHTEAVTKVAFSPDGKHVLTGTKDDIKVWDAENGQELYSLKEPGDRFAFSPDGKRFLTGERGGLKVWDTGTGQELIALQGVDYPAAFSPDGKRFLIGAKVWDAEKGQDNAWPLPDRAERHRYHGYQTVLAEKEKQYFAAAFHLGRLLLDSPNDPDLKRRRDAALKGYAAQPARPERVP